MTIGDPILVARPVLTRGRLSHTWQPATVASVSPVAIVAVFADFTRREYQLDGYAIRALTQESTQ